MVFNLIKRRKNVYTFYIALHLASLLLMSFSMNMPEYPWATFVFAHRRLDYGYRISLAILAIDGRIVKVATYFHFDNIGGIRCLKTNPVK